LIGKEGKKEGLTREVGSYNMKKGKKHEEGVKEKNAGE